MPSKDFLYLASSLFWGIFCYIQISMYTIFSCYTHFTMVYWKSELSKRILSRMSAQAYPIMSALFVKEGGDYYE